MTRVITSDTTNRKHRLSLISKGLWLPLLASFGLVVASSAQIILPQSAYASGIIRLKDNGANTTQRVPLGLNKSLVIDLPRDAYDLLVASPGVADAVIRTKRRIYLFGKGVGETNIFVFDKNSNPILSMNLVVEREISNIKERLQKFIPGSDITVELINDNIVLTGTVQTPQDSARAASLARAFVTGGEATTGSFTQTAESSPSNSGQGSSFGAVEISQPPIRESAVINLLKIAGEDQVTLKVTIAEVQRSVYKQLGFNLNGSVTGSSIQFASSGTANFGLGGALGGSGGVLNGNFGDTSFSASMNAFERSGVARTLAEPSLTAISGKQARFRVGGSYYTAGGRSVGVETINGVDQPRVDDTYTEREYGISLDFRPVVLGPGRISIQMKTEVSEPDVSGSVPLANGGSFVGIRTREAETTVELPSGGSMVIAGLVQDSLRQAISKIPALGNLPVLGALFRSRDFQRDETELVIIVTPYLVRPVARHKLQRPDDNFKPASDLQAGLLGRINEVYGRKPSSAKYNGKIGFIIQ